MAQEQPVEPVPGYILSPQLRKGSQKWFGVRAEGRERRKAEQSGKRGKGKGKRGRERRGR